MVIIKGKLIGSTIIKHETLDDEITRFVLDTKEFGFQGFLFYGEVHFIDDIKEMDTEFRQTITGCGPWKKVVQYITGDDWGIMHRKSQIYVKKLCDETNTEYCLDLNIYRNK